MSSRRTFLDGSQELGHLSAVRSLGLSSGRASELSSGITGRFLTRYLRLELRVRVLTEKARGYRALSTQRRHLAQLSDAALKDMGISRYDASYESSKPFWKE
jgi:uncharacterized protein YjiS (DUF1127 family)